MSTTEKGFLRHIQNLNSWNPQHFRGFYIGSQRVGHVKDYMCQALAQWPGYFCISDTRVELVAGEDFNSRSQRLDEVVRKLVEQGVIAHYLDEIYPVTGYSRDHQLAVLDRGAAAYFGIKAYGQHVNGYVKQDDGIYLWIARRSADRIQFPNKLDNLVAGGLPQDLTLQQNLVKECQEEADIPENLAKSAIAAGAITYCRETQAGLKPDTLYCYDLSLPPSFSPENTDGEVSDFQLLNVEQVYALVHDTDDFKLNCNLVIIDFFIRHGIIPPDSTHYLEIVNGLHEKI